MTKSRADLLIELGVEELPTSYIEPALQQFATELKEAVAEMKLASGDMATFSTPRRLAVLLTDIVSLQEDFEEEATGPPASAAWNENGEPTKALLGFVKGKGAELQSVRRIRTAKGEYAAVTVKWAGKRAADLIPEAVAKIVPKLQFPKSMRWQSGSEARFARPIRWIVAIYGDDVLDLELFGVKSGRISFGHRFIHPGGIAIANPTKYVSALAAASVVADPRLRWSVILEDAQALASEVGGRLVDDRELVLINADLVEKPTALRGKFDQGFLELPREVIVTALREHQRYFAVEDQIGRLLPFFISIRNGDDRNLAVISKGNESVLKARLEDARFYWNTDLKKAPGDRVDELSGIVWLAELGTMREKVERIRSLGAWVAEKWNSAIIATVERAALLSKTDLLSEMIGSGKEYASLEGLMGSYYAAHFGETDGVVMAIREHVLPKGADDQLPSSEAGAILSIADKIDSVVGVFAADKAPTGSQDPYGTRRAANGVVRILLDQQRHLNLIDASNRAVSLFGEKVRPEPYFDEMALLRFWKDRVEWALIGEAAKQDLKSTAAVASYDLMKAVVERGGESWKEKDGWADPYDAWLRLVAIRTHRQSPDFIPLVIGFKRVANILKASKDSPGRVMGDFADPHEAALATAVLAASQIAEPLFAARDYGQVLDVLLSLRGAIDTFFEKVMVNADDADVRRRRLGLLAVTRSLFDRGWDLSKVVVEGP